MSQAQLQAVLKDHETWQRTAGLEGKQADLIVADLRGDDLGEANLRGADLRGAYLSEANLRGANLSGANLTGADLRGAYLSEANLSEANLSGANLLGADLGGANLTGADLRGANLTGADLINAEGIRTFQSGQHLAVAYMNWTSIAIGCEDHSIEHWLANYEEIGKKNDYSEEEIQAYGKFILGIDSK